VAAGGLLVIEAGGRVTDVAGSPAPAAWGFGRNVVASNGPLHAPLTAHLAPFRGE
jgi:fructose-1,6-bisphosphatase/inositol monophosphatase family enzyme